MKTILSINYKFFEISPKEFIDIVVKNDKQNLIRGFEAVTKSKDEEEYLKKFAKITSDNGYIVNLHAPSLCNVEQYESYLDFAVEISKIQRRKVNIVFHPINADSLEESKKVTNCYVTELTEYIAENKYNEYIELSLENLNDFEKIKRLKKENLIDILNENQDIKFTYDIGHEMMDDMIKKDKLNEILAERLNNVHIHTKGELEDHYPIIEKTEKHTKQVLEKTKQLIESGYNGDIVMEYAIDYIDGKNLKEKLICYINCAKIILTSV